MVLDQSDSVIRSPKLGMPVYPTSYITLATLSEASSHNDPVEFVRPSRTLVLAAIVLALVAVAADYAFDHWLFPAAKEWIATASSPADREARFATVIGSLLTLVVAFGIAVAAWFWFMSIRMYRQGLFPPPGYPILVRTTVRRGADARRQARLHALYGAFCIAVCAYFVGSLFAIFPIAALLWGRGG